MSAHHTLPIPRKAPRSEGEGVHAELMRQIGAKSYDPMPSTQHRWLMDISNPPPMRIMGFLYSVTIGAGKELKRSAYARDERGPVKVERVAGEFGWTVSRTNVYLRQLEETGHIRVDEKGWIWLGGAVEEPRRTHSEDEGDKEREKEGADLWPYIGDEEFSLYLHQLSKNGPDDSTRAAARASAQRTAELEALEKRAIAEAKAIIRAQISARIDEEKKAVRFPVGEGRGRPRKERPDLVIQLTLLPLTINGHISEAISVHNSKTTSGQKENTSGQNGSYIEEQSTENTEKTLRSAPEENEREISASSSSEKSLPNPTTTIDAHQKPVEQANVKPSITTADERRIVAEAVMPFAIPDRQSTTELIIRCRQAAPDVTAEEIAVAIGEKAPLARGPRPIGFLLTAVPPLFADGGLEEIRGRAPRPVEEPPVPQEPSEECEIETLTQLLEAFPNHKDVPEMQARLAALKARVK